MAKQTKYVTKEYHEGATAYERGEALTSNPYMTTNVQTGKASSAGELWYWMFGWQDALADDVRNIKETIIAAATTNTSGGIH